MARYTGQQCRLCRREGQKLFLKGEKCYTERCAYEKRSYAPGQFGPVRRKRLTVFGEQLREKQKLRRVYGVLENQFRSYYYAADRSKGPTGDNLLSLLETRLDNVAYRMGFGASRNEARQIIRHNGISVDGVRVNIPSFQVKVGHVIALIGSAVKQLRIEASMEAVEQRGWPEWLEVDRKKKQGQMIAQPSEQHLMSDVKVALVVALYSK